MTTSRSPRAITASGSVVLGGCEPGNGLDAGAGVPLQGADGGRGHIVLVQHCAFVESDTWTP